VRALKIKIRGLKKRQFERLKVLTHHSKNLYNQTLWTLREAVEATGKYFSYSKMDKVMKQVTNLEGEVNYKLLKAKVAQQTLRRLDKNFRSFFRCHQDFQKNPGKYPGKPKPPKYKKDKHDNLIYDYQAFQIQGLFIIEKALEITLPNSFCGIKTLNRWKLFQNTIASMRFLFMKKTLMTLNRSSKMIKLCPLTLA